MTAGLPDKEGAREALTASCHACGELGLEAFFALDDVPAHSCVVTDTSEAARQVPRGRILLAVCHSCGFVQNVRFDSAIVDYSRPYEESQAHSPHFVAFAEELASRLVADHDLVGATATDIGSGKGDFLRRLLDAGLARGVGVDPSARAERVPPDYAGRITLVPEFFDDVSRLEPADLVCCRHTLEHIAPVADFTRRLVELARRRDGATIFIEVPDVARVLTEGAFWDVYHEHCSYFTAGSLRRMLQHLGLEVDSTRLGFDDQYILADARVPTDGRPPLHDEGDVESIVAAAGRFASTTAATIEHWTYFLDDKAARNERVVLWGGGSKAVAFLSATIAAPGVAEVVDINPYRQGIHLPPTGVRVVAPEALKERRPDHVIVMNPIYVDEIAANLARLGVNAQLHALRGHAS